MIQQSDNLNQSLYGILARCQMKPQITQTQVRSMIQIIVNSILEIKQQKDQILPDLHLSNKMSVQNSQTLIESIKKQKQLFEKINEKIQITMIEVNNKFKQLQSKFQLQYKLYSQHISNQGYYMEKRLYQKLKYLFEQINKKVDIVHENKITHFISHNHPLNSSKRERNQNYQSLRKISLNEEKDLSTYGRKSLQPRDFKQVMTEEDFFRESDEYYQNSYSLVEKQSSLQNVQSFMSTQKITFANQTNKPMIKPIQINIKAQGAKRSCKIKIQTTRMWIAIGVLDISQAQKPIQSIERCVYYCNNKQVWDGHKLSYNEGIGFVTGDTVQILFDLGTKMVEWKVKKKLRHSLKFYSLSFRYNWVPFVYFYNKNDSISVIPYEK